MYKDISVGDYPKTLVIRNHEGGMVWQVYHVEKLIEAERLAGNATRNGFQAITLEDYQPDREETFPDWRETDGGKEIITPPRYIGKGKYELTNGDVAFATGVFLRRDTRVNGGWVVESFEDDTYYRGSIVNSDMDSNGGVTYYIEEEE